MNYENMTNEQIAADTAAKREYCDPEKNKNWHRASTCIMMLSDLNLYLAGISVGISLYKIIKG